MGFRHKHLSGHSLPAPPSHGRRGCSSALCTQDVPCCSQAHAGETLPWGSSWGPSWLSSSPWESVDACSLCCHREEWSTQPGNGVPTNFHIIIYLLLEVFTVWSPTKNHCKMLPQDMNTISPVQVHKKSRQAQILKVLMFYLITVSTLWQPKSEKKIILAQGLNNLAGKIWRGEKLSSLPMFVSPRSFLLCTCICKYI